jgi:hypothetical protein
MARIATERDRERWVTFMHSQPLPLELECKPWRNKRSSEQNAYLWRAVYQPLVEVAGFTKERWHEYFCGEYFGWTDDVLPGDRVHKRPARTTTTGLDGKRDVINAQDFARFVQFLESELADMGVFITEALQHETSGH